MLFQLSFHQCSIGREPLVISSDGESDSDEDIHSLHMFPDGETYFEGV